MKVSTIDFNSKTASSELLKSLKETGFAVIRHHPINKKLIKEVYQEWEQFFKNNNKHSYKFNPSEQSGYFPFKSENAADSKIKDLKEFFHVYKESQIPHEISHKTWELRNQLDMFGITLLSWIQNELPEEIKKSFSMDLVSMVKDSPDTLFRALHYPPLLGDVEEGAVRAYEHFDINVLTTLLTASGPNGDYFAGKKTGLEVQDLEGNWHEIESDPDSIIINCGDFLQILTKGYLKSTRHRVKNPLGEASKLSRYTLPLFIHPHGEVILEGNKTAREFLNERLREIGLKK